MLKYYNSFYCNSFSVIVRRRERSDRAPSSGRSERSERDRTTIKGSEATVRHHRQGASEASGIEPRSEGAKRPCAIIRQERAKRCAISEVRERSDRSRASEASVRRHTASGRGSEATVRNHRQGASEASGIEPHI